MRAFEKNERRAALYAVLVLLAGGAALKGLSPFFRLQPRPDDGSYGGAEEAAPGDSGEPGTRLRAGSGPVGGQSIPAAGLPGAQAGRARLVLRWLWPFWDGTSKGSSAAFDPRDEEEPRKEEGAPVPRAGAAPPPPGRRQRQAILPRRTESGALPPVMDSTLSVYAPSEGVLSAGQPAAIGGGGRALEEGGVGMGKTVPVPSELPKVPAVKKGSCVPAGDWSQCDSVGKKELTDGQGVVWTRWECLKRSIDGTWSLLFKSGCNPSGAPMGGTASPPP